MAQMDNKIDVRVFRRSFLYYSGLIDKLLPGNYRNNDFGYLPYYINQLETSIRNFLQTHEDQAVDVIVDLMKQPNIVGWYFIMQSLDSTDNEKLLDIIVEIAMMPDAIIYHGGSPTIDIFAMLDLLHAKIHDQNSIIDIHSPPKYNDLRNIASRILIKSDHELPDNREFISFFKNQKNFSIGNLKGIIEDRRCCQMNGKNGDSYCSICGRIIPEEFRLKEE